MACDASARDATSSGVVRAMRTTKGGRIHKDSSVREGESTSAPYLGVPKGGGFDQGGSFQQYHLVISVVFVAPRIASIK